MYFNSIEFGKRLQKSRKDLALTQEELGSRVGVQGNHISCLERGAKTCSIDLLVLLSETLNVSADYLLRGEIRHKEDKEKLIKITRQMTRIIQRL